MYHCNNPGQAKAPSNQHFVVARFSDFHFQMGPDLNGFWSNWGWAAVFTIQKLPLRGGGGVGMMEGWVKDPCAMPNGGSGLGSKTSMLRHFSKRQAHLRRHL